MSVHRFLMRCATISCLLFATGHALSQSIVSAGFSGSGATLLGGEVDLGKLAPASTGFVNIIYTDSAGRPIGTDQKGVPVSPTGVVKLTPVGSQGGLGNKVIIEDSISKTTFVTLRIRDSRWFFDLFGGSSLVILPARPEPGRQIPIVLDPAVLNLIDVGAPAGSRPHTMVASNFELMFSSAGGDNYDAAIVGDDSFIRLDDETYIDFPDASHFGSIELAPGSNSGAFAFSAIGLSGIWSFDPASGRTTATLSGLVPFAAPSLAFIAEPPTAVLVVGALGMLLGIGRRRSGANRLTLRP